MFLRKRISNTLKHNCNSHWNWHFWDLLSKESISALKKCYVSYFSNKMNCFKWDHRWTFLNKVCNKSSWKLERYLCAASERSLKFFYHFLPYFFFEPVSTIYVFVFYRWSHYWKNESRLEKRLWSVQSYRQ